MHMLDTKEVRVSYKIHIYKKKKIITTIVGIFYAFFHINVVLDKYEIIKIIS